MDSTEDILLIKQVTYINTVTLILLSCFLLCLQTYTNMNPEYNV